MPKHYTSECRIVLAPILGLALLATVFSLALLAAPRTVAAESNCDAFSLSAAAAEAGGAAAGALDTPGVQPSKQQHVDEKLLEKGSVDGSIIAIPGGARTSVMNRVAGEALLVLPKLPNGELANDFTLGPDAKIVDSFWSPVLCASLVRVRGPRDAQPADLVPRVAPPAVVLPHARYRTSAAKVRPAKPEEMHGPDPYRPLQLGLAQLGVMQARGRTDGRGARVALLDSAPDVKHRELAHVRVLPLEGGPPATPALHGTLMAGLIAAIEDNAFGIVGVAPAADLVAIPVCTPVGDGTSDGCDLFDVLHGMDVAWQQEASILNLSLAGPPDPLLQRAVTRLLELGVVVVAAAGNGSSALPTYPAAYPGVIGVGAVDSTGQPYAQGNRGPWVSVAGPGVEILSTTPDDSFAFVNGTSLAAAQISGVLALLTSVVQDPVRMRMALLATARGSLVPASVETDSPATAGAPVSPTVCDVLKDIGQPCSGSTAASPKIP
jgi:subtilisin family serine protease